MIHHGESFPIYGIIGTMINQEIFENAKKRLTDYEELKSAGLIPFNGEFLPSVHYPPITMYPGIDEEALFKEYTNPPDDLFVIYVHIPFCIRYCNFCHYPNLIGDLPEEKSRYLTALEKEMDIYMRRLDIKKIKARSILVGGGTPTYLTPKMLDKFLKFFTGRLDLSSCTQFNYDVDPNTLIGSEGAERLKILRSYGVNRLTIGFQSLNDRILQDMNRSHNAEMAITSLKRAKEEGFQVCIEFIYGYPGETLETWFETMEKAVSLGADEIQLYHLKIIPYGDHSAAIYKKFIESKTEFHNAETILLMKEIASLILNKNGYNENLTRVFTTKKEYFSHYAADQCCNLFDQIGFGITAFSSLRDRFGLNTQSFNEYYDMIGQDKLPLNRGLVRTVDDQLRWHMILPLKNRKVFKNMFQKRVNVSLDKIFRKKINILKCFDLIYENEKVLALAPRGRFFADEVCQQFHHVKYMPFPPSSYAHGPLYPYDNCQP